MANHALTSDSLSGTVTGRLTSSGDDTLCVIDLAARSLGVLSAAHPHTMLRGTITFVQSPAGQCVPLEHSISAADGQKVASSTIQSLVEQVHPFATQELQNAPVVSPVTTEAPLATVLPIAARAYA